MNGPMFLAGFTKLCDKAGRTAPQNGLPLPASTSVQMTPRERKTIANTVKSTAKTYVAQQGDATDPTIRAIADAPSPAFKSDPQQEKYIINCVGRPRIKKLKQRKIEESYNDERSKRARSEGGGASA